MSEIPIGSPPAPPGRHAAPQGWYPDPVDASRERYWDGWSWTRNTRGAESGQPPSAGRSGQQPPQYGQPQYGQPQYGQSQPGQQQPGPQQVPPPQGQPGPYGTGYPQPQQQPYGGAPMPAGGGGDVARTDDGVPLAGWWWRFLAGVLDLILVGILSTLAALPFYLKMVPVITDYLAESMAAAERGEIAAPLEPTELTSPGDQMWIALISAAVGVLYFALFWRFKSATPAQLLCGLRVVPFGQGGSTEQLRWSQVIVRAVLWSVPFTVANLLLIFGLVNGLSPLWNRNKQAIHDLAARTQLVKIK